MVRKLNPPKGLSRKACKIWRVIQLEYGIRDSGGLAILDSGIKSLDLTFKCEETLQKEGLTVVDRFDQKKPHPLLPTLRDARAQWLQAVKALNLDLEPLQRQGRPATGGRTV